MDNTIFWQTLATLVAHSDITIDRPKGTPHPRHPDIIYPLDYGYLQGTTSGDGSGIDVWLGSLPARTITAILVTVDVPKRDSEIKILLGCTSEEHQVVLALHRRFPGSMSALLVERDQTNSST